MLKKKLFKRISIFVVLLFALLLLLPFLLKDTLIKKYVALLNKDYNIQISYTDVNLSLIKHFPSATLAIDNLLITTEKPFEGDTLLFSKSVFLDINIQDAFNKKAEKTTIKELTFDNALVQLMVNKQGVNNYTIQKKIKQSKNISNAEPITFDIAKYTLTNSTILFDDAQSKTFLKLKNINHNGSGDFSSEASDLITKTTVQDFTFKQNGIAYFNKANLDLDAVLGIDFNDNKYTFKENTAKINDLALTFKGFVKVSDKAVDTDISFQSPKANFKSLLSLIPSAYASNFKGVTANGIANVSGFVKGKSSDTETPQYEVHVSTNNARFKYPDLPKAVENIHFKGAIVNKSKANNAFLKIENMTFRIDKDVFETKGKISNLTSNPLFDTAFKGTLNLANLTQAYPIQLDTKLTGILKADFTTYADQKAIENNNFNKIKTNGVASLQDFSYNGKDVAKPIHVKNATVNFNNTTTHLTAFDAKTGDSDIKATGTIENLYGFLFNDKNLKGNFKVTSENFLVADFLTDDTASDSENSSTTESLKIPKFLDVTSHMTAQKVVYDQVEMKNVSGIMILKNQQAILKNVKASMLQGDVAFNGLVNTQVAPSLFDVDMKIDGFNIASSFTQLETFQKLIPIATALKGSYNSAFKIKGNLNDDFSLNINSIDGNALAQLFVKNLNTNLPLFTALGSQLQFLDVTKLNLDKLKTALTFKNGRVEVKPFDVKYKDITMHVSGNHGFDKTLAYDVTMDLPAKYLGNDAVNLLATLTDAVKDTIRIPLKALINGSINKPNVQANIKQAMKALVVKVAKYQKDKLLNEATNQANDAINEVLENNGISIAKDSTATPNTTSPSAGGIIKDAAGSILGGLLGGKKKKKKDSVN